MCECAAQSLAERLCRTGPWSPCSVPLFGARNRTGRVGVFSPCAHDATLLSRRVSRVRLAETGRPPCHCLVNGAMPGHPAQSVGRSVGFCSPLPKNNARWPAGSIWPCCLPKLACCVWCGRSNSDWQAGKDKWNVGRSRVIMSDVRIKIH